MDSMDREISQRSHLGQQPIFVRDHVLARVALAFISVDGIDVGVEIGGVCMVLV